MVDDLVKFLRARLDDDERIAKRTRAESYTWRNFDMDGELRECENAGTVAYIPNANNRTHIARHDPARVLSEIDAKRQTLAYLTDELADWALSNPWWYEDKLLPILRLLALPYAGHPDYRTDWAPNT